MISLTVLYVYVYIVSSVLLDTVARVREYILSNPDVYNDMSKFILGGGWDHTVWPTAGWPTAVCRIFFV